MDLVKHAEYELRRSGLFKKDSDYGEMLGKAVLKMVRVFAAEGHSGASASMALEIFNRVARFRTLSPITNDPGEWVEVSQYMSGEKSPVFQNKRDPSFFSNDGGKTGYSVDDKNRKIHTFDAPKP